MQEDKRKLGRVTKWYKCPSCGVREEIIDEQLEAYRENKIAQQIKKKKNKEMSTTEKATRIIGFGLFNKVSLSEERTADKD